MDEPVICPLCNTEYPAGSSYCPICMSPIEPVKSCWEGDDRESPATPSDFDDGHDLNYQPVAEAGQVQCPNCGDVGRPGESCRTCGSPLPSAADAPAQQKQESEMHQPVEQCEVVIILPDGTPISPPLGIEVLIGRESSNDCIRRSLEKYDNVSREHCYLLISSDGATATIRDEHSTNGTWIESGSGSFERIPFHQPVSKPLPFRIRLGQRLYVAIGQ